MDDGGYVGLGVDVGGTFTDVVLVADGRRTTTKVLTTDEQSEGVLAGIEAACEQAGVDPESVDEFRHAMTVGTNALLEGTGAQVALVTTEGFADVVEIGRQDRPALYDLSAEKPDPLVPPERRHEVAERTTPDGVEVPLWDDHADRGDLADRGALDDIDDLDHLVAAIDDDIESIAVSLLHSYADPTNEQRLAGELRESLDATVIPSHETLPEFREYERTATTVVDAYLTPVIDRYLSRLVEACEAWGLPEPRIMQSNGGIADAGTIRRHAVTTALSGPAAGVVGASVFEGDSAGVVSFDMGGTSTDVGLVRDGDLERTTDGSVAGYPVHVPMVDVETVGAGGGSVAWVDAGGALRVGPASAGANPGPACYGRGGAEPTVTDAALVLGYLGEGMTLGDDAAPGDAVTLDAERARSVLADLATAADLAGPTAAARGVRRVATATMARAVRRVTLDRGHDPRQFTLVAFGGAGPMFACGLAEHLGLDSIRIPRATGVLSAFGLLAADERHDASRTVQRPLDAVDRKAMDDEYERLVDRLEPDVAGDPTVQRAADLRYEGQNHELTVPVPDPFDPAAVAQRFDEAHERRRGYRLPDEPVQLVTVRVTLRVPRQTPELSHRGTDTEPIRQREASFDEELHRTPVYRWESLATEATVEGPAIFEGGESTVVLRPGWEATLDARGTLHLEGES